MRIATTGMAAEQERVHGQAVGCGWDGYRARCAGGWCDQSGLGSSGDKDKQKTFTVEALTTEQAFEGTALGDQIVFTSQLLKGETEVGHQAGVCIVTSVARAEAQCVATYVFCGGQITGQALIRLGDPTPYAGAITEARASTRAPRVRSASSPSPTPEGS